MNVAALSAKNVVRSNYHPQVQISWLTTVGAGLSLPGHANPCSILYAGGDSHFDRIGMQRHTVSLTGWTGATAKGSAAVAGGAWHGLLQGHAFGDTGEHLGQRQLYLRFKILALHGKSATIAGSPSTFEQILEDVGKAFSAE